MAQNDLCGPCRHDNNIKHAKKWCTNCEEGLCEGCEKVHGSLKMSRNHNLISIQDHQKMIGVSIVQSCFRHGQRYNLYCSSHDVALCSTCVDQLRLCLKVVPLDEAAVNAKRSTALADLEDTINGALQNVGKIIKDQESASTTFKKQEVKIRNSITETRDKLNKHLDCLEQILVQELTAKSNNCKSANGKTLQNLKLANQRLEHLKQEIEKMKMLGSNLQIFLGTREINKIVTEEIKSIKSSVSKIKLYKISFGVDSMIMSLAENVRHFGKLLVTESNADFSFKDTKIEQAQIQVSMPTTNIHDINLHLKQKFKIKKSGPYGYNVERCAILPNGHLLIAHDLGKDQLTEFNEKGQHIRDIPLLQKPNDLTVIDSNQIAISYGRHIEIVDVTFKRVNKKFKLPECCVGLSYQNGKLYLVAREIGIMVYELSGKLVNTFYIAAFNVMHIATAVNRIYFTDEGKNTINCYDMNGQKIWVTRIKSISLPSGLAIGENDDVFVAGSASNNITIIRHDGKDSKTLLTSADGIDEPQAIYNDKQRKILLVCDKASTNAALYTVA